MRALTRMRTLAAVCALLLMLAGTAAAGLPGKPIDRPGDPPSGPPQVGDPDQPTGGSIVVVIGDWVVVFRTPYIRIGLFRATVPVSPVRSIRRSEIGRGRNAR